MASQHRNVSLRHLHTVLNAGAVGGLADGVLLERFLAGRGDADSSAAFAALVERHGPMVLRVCRDVLDDLHHAEDASQATFLILARNARSVRRIDSLASWLFGVALRAAAKARTRGARQRATERRGGEMKARTRGDGERGDGWPGLYEELGRLPERYRAPIVLCHLEELTNEQAASQFGLPVRTVQRRLAQGRERLRARLVRRGWEPAAGLFGMTEFAADGISELWLEATVRAALGVAAGQATATVASVAVTTLTQGVMTMMLMGRLKSIALGLITACAVVTAVVAAGAAIAARRAAQPAARQAKAGFAGVTTPAQAGPWIKGLVVDSAGRPVEGARVTSHWTLNAKSVTTKADGTFVLANDEPRLANLAFLATADGGERQGIFRFQDLTGSKDARTLARIVLEPARVVTVTAVDGRGKPVEGAAVFVLDLIFPVAEGRTDASGVAALRAPAGAMTLLIFGYKPGVGFDYFENYRTTPPARISPPPERARLVLDNPRTVRIRAVDSAGGPVPGVPIVPDTIFKNGKLRSVQVSASPVGARTDQHGAATFNWLPADIRAGTSFVLFSASSYLAKPLVLEPGEAAAELTAHVVRYTPIAGKVTHPDGSPAPGVMVLANGVGAANPAGWGKARTTADGSYNMELPPEQSYMVYVADDEWAARSRGGIVVREGKAQIGLDLMLERASVITGRVTAGPHSQPAAGLPLMLVEHGPAVPPGTLKDQTNPLSDATVRIADTDTGGRYAFRVGPGDYELIGPREPGAEPGREPAPVPEQLRVAGGERIQRDFTLRRVDRPSRTIRGIVRAGTEGGPPVAGAIVIGEPTGANGPEPQGSADGSGRFELPRPSGKVLIYTRNPKGDLAGYAIFGEDDDNEVTIVAKPAAMVRGRVVDSAGKPRAGVSVACRMYLGLDGDGRAGAGQGADTDAEGRFAIPGLLIKAQCKLFAHNRDGGSSSEHRFAVKDTGAIDVGAIVLDPRGSRLGTR